MGRLAKALVVLLLLGFVALVGYAYYPGTLTPPARHVDQPVQLNVD